MPRQCSICSDDENGNYFLIEMQRGVQHFFKDRCLYYTSRLISEQAPKGGIRSWNYELTAVYLVALMETFTFEDSGQQQIIRHIELADKETGKEFYNKLGYIYIQLANFVKEENELQTGLDLWLYLIKHLSRLDKIPVMMRKPVFAKLFEIAEVSKLSKEERMDYERSLKIKWDNYSTMQSMREEGKLEGIREGMQKGMQKGKFEGIREGEERKSYEIVKNLILKMSLTDEQAAGIADVTVDFVRKVRAELNQPKQD